MLTAINGYKTYIVAGITVAFAIVSYWNGSMTFDQATALALGGAGLARADEVDRELDRSERLDEACEAPSRFVIGALEAPIRHGRLLGSVRPA